MTPGSSYRRFDHIINPEPLSLDHRGNGSVDTEKFGHPDCPFQLTRSPPEGELCRRMDDLLPGLEYFQGVSYPKAGELARIDVKMSGINFGNGGGPIQKIELAKKTVQDIVQTDLNGFNDSLAPARLPRFLCSK